MTDIELIGYLLDALEPQERTAVEMYLHANPAAVDRMEALKTSLALLAVDRDIPAVPAGLATRTLARIAAHVAGPDETTPVPARGRLGAPPRAEPELPVIGGRFRFDVIVAASIALVAFGLVFSAIGRVRANHQMVACQNTLRTVHVGLTGYADTHAGRYPQIGIGPNTTADAFARALTDSGQIPPGFLPCCPTLVATTNPQVGYTYSLGYREPGGTLLGFTRNRAAGEHDFIPISTDFPTPPTAPTDGPTCPHQRGMNVLYLGGHVQVSVSAMIGPMGDDIFRNLRGAVAAGTDPRDVVLGRPGDRP
jgi:prepilin-type processing-associated H-X9-DG protein